MGEATPTIPATTFTVAMPRPSAHPDENEMPIAPFRCAVSSFDLELGYR